MKPLSYSANATLMSCARKFKHSYVDLWEPMEENVPAYAGKVMAEGLLALHTQLKARWILGPHELTKVHEEVCEVLEKAWGNFKHNNPKYSYLTLGHLETVMWYYITERDPQQVQALSESGKLLAEEKVTFDWAREWKGNLDLIQVTGIPDIPAIVAGQKAVVDWKCTTQYVNNWWAKKFSVIGHQLRTYMGMLRHHYGIETEVAYVDAIHIGKKAAESAKMWKGLQSKRSRLFGPFNFTESQRQETWEWYKTGYAMREFFEKHGHWPQNEGACGDYGGCDFQQLCGISPKIRSARAPMIYRQKDEKEK